MFSFPAAPATDLIRNQMQTQLDFFSTMVVGMLDASLQLGRLNTRATRRLVEESAAAVEKSMALRTPADTQAFLLEQSQLTINRITGYSRNAGAIFTSQSSSVPAAITIAVTDGPADMPSDAPRTPASSAAPHGQHDVDPHPSPLVEKLIASVVDDAKPH